MPPPSLQDVLTQRAMQQRTQALPDPNQPVGDPEGDWLGKGMEFTKGLLGFGDTQSARLGALVGTGASLAAPLVSMFAGPVNRALATQKFRNTAFAADKSWNAARTSPKGPLPIGKEGGAFADYFPRIAAHLGINPDVIPSYDIATSNTKAGGNIDTAAFPMKVSITDSSVATAHPAFATELTRHEGAHGAQALGLGRAKPGGGDFQDLYKEADRIVGYERNPFERRAFSTEPFSDTPYRSFPKLNNELMDIAAEGDKKFGPGGGDKIRQILTDRAARSTWNPTPGYQPKFDPTTIRGFTRDELINEWEKSARSGKQGTFSKARPGERGELEQVLDMMRSGDYNDVLRDFSTTLRPIPKGR